MRRVIIGENKKGRSAVLKDDKAAKVVYWDSDSGRQEFLNEIWATDETPSLPYLPEDPTTTMTSFVPPPGGTRCRLLYYPPEKEFATSGSKAWLEFSDQAPGFEHNLDPETGIHMTNTIDYGFIVSGKIDLELDDGAEVQLKAGDAFVLKGTRHAWHNRSSTPCVFVVFMVGTHNKA